MCALTPGRHVPGQRHCGGFTLMEILVAMLIVGLLSAIAMPEYQKYQYRARAAGIVIESGPVKRAIEVYLGTAGQGQYKAQLANGTDHSIVGCQAPAGVQCGDTGAGPVQIVVPADQLLVSRGTIRIVAALCEVDCPSYALSYNADLNAVGTAATVSPSAASPPAATTPPVTPPAATPDPVAPPATTPAVNGQGQGKAQGKGQSKGNADVGPWLPLVSSAYAQSDQYQFTNRVLYEFGELQRRRVHSSDNDTCLVATGACTVTLKF